MSPPACLHNLGFNQFWAYKYISLRDMKLCFVILCNQSTVWDVRSVVFLAFPQLRTVGLMHSMLWRPQSKDCSGSRFFMLSLQRSRAVCRWRVIGGKGTLPSQYWKSVFTQSRFIHFTTLILAVRNVLGVQDALVSYFETNWLNKQAIRIQEQLWYLH